MATHEGRRQITEDQAATFEKAQEKLSIFLTDLQKLSNKKPDGPLNAFKLRFINQVLATVNQLLGEEYRPFPDFTAFDVEGSLPTASDVVMMLSQYQNAMQRFRRDHQTDDDLLEPFKSGNFVTPWNISDADDEQAKGLEAEEEA